VRILEKLLEIDYHFLGSLKRLGGIGLVPRIEVFASHAFCVYVYLVFSSLFRREVVGVHLELGGYGQVL
jgi:hypothetical protein